jgi:hypothetical protein
MKLQSIITQEKSMAQIELNFVYYTLTCGRIGAFTKAECSHYLHSFLSYREGNGNHNFLIKLEVHMKQKFTETKKATFCAFTASNS